MSTRIEISQLDSSMSQSQYISYANGDADDGMGHSVQPQRDVYMTPYERLTFDLSHDKKVMREVMLGKRIGFYRIRGELGSGNFSQVKLGVQILTREKVAIKILDKTKLDAKTQRLLSREISSMEKLHHPNVIRLYEVIETLAKLYLVMECAGEGELFTKISNDGRIQESDSRPIFAQIVSAVRHMHENQIIHRDLKAENIFFSSARCVKVGDFGFSTYAHTSQALNTFCGSPPYAAPELFRDDSYDGPLVDVWALGIILYFMITGVLPFRADTVGKLKKCILTGVYTIPNYVSESCERLIKSILKQEPGERLSLKKIRESAWLSGEDFFEAMDAFNLYSISKQHRNGDVLYGGASTKIGSLPENKSSNRVDSFSAIRLSASQDDVENDPTRVNYLEGEDEVDHSPSNKVNQSAGRISYPMSPERTCRHSPILSPDGITSPSRKSRSSKRSISTSGRNSRWELSEDELTARRICLELGIGDDLLEVGKSKGLRSGITGTYHIVLHRLQKQHSEIDNPIPEKLSLGPSSGHTLAAAIRSGRDGGITVVNRDKKKSKLCVVL